MKTKRDLARKVADKMPRTYWCEVDPDERTPCDSKRELVDHLRRFHTDEEAARILGG